MVSNGIGRHIWEELKEDFLHAAASCSHEGKKIRYWWLDFSGADAGLRTILVLYLDIPRCK